jgi:hypothetical protein
MRARATWRALAWSLGCVALVTLAVALGLLLVDLSRFDGSCPGSLLPFVGETQPRDCDFNDYFAGHGLFTLRLLVATTWPIALLFVVVAVAIGVARDRRHDGSDRP